MQKNTKKMGNFAITTRTQKENVNTKCQREKGKRKGKYQRQKGKGKRKWEIPKSKGKREREKEILNTKREKREGNLPFPSQFYREKEIPVDL